MHKKSPLVSVLLPFTRVDEYLEEAAQSIFTQTYTNLEILFLDNQLRNQAIEYKPNDDRAKVVDCRSLNSLSLVLNHGLKFSHGIYIARMDSDDISESTRFEKQVEFLESNEIVGVLGTGIQEISETGARLEIRLQPSSHEGVLRKIPFNNPFFHPTIMFRRTALQQVKGPYLSAFRRSQDYELWTRLLFVTKGGNINEPLVAYRLHANQSGRRVPHQSVLYFRLAQLKYVLFCAMKKKRDVSWKTVAVSSRNFLVILIKYTVKLLILRVVSLNRKI